MTTVAVTDSTKTTAPSLSPEAKARRAFLKQKIKEYQADSLALNRRIAELKQQGPHTGPERCVIKREKAGIGDATRQLLLAYAVERGRPLWSQESLRSKGGWSAAMVTWWLQRAACVAQGITDTDDAQEAATGWTEAKVLAALQPFDQALAKLTADVEALGADKDAIRKLLAGKDRLLRQHYSRQEKVKLFRPEQAQANKVQEHTSPSGRYRLRITPYSFGSKHWAYTLGEVFDGERKIAEIHRNYSAFPFLFIEDHPNKHAYLVAGEDYQGQTVIELDTGRRRDLLPGLAENGWGFCWASYRFDPKAKLLVVAGCHWACPYEYRFFDFARPMAGWPELKTDECIYDDNRWPTVDADGVITTYQTPDEDDSDDEDDGTGTSNGTDGEKKLLPPVATINWKRQGRRLVKASEWVSEGEQQKRAENEAANERYKAWLQAFRTSDPLYLAYERLLKETPGLNPDRYESHGWTFSGWCPGKEYNEKRWCRTIVASGPQKKLVIELEWGVDTGPVKLVIYGVAADGAKKEEFFPHSVEGMEAAFAAAAGYVAASAAERKAGAA